MSRIVKKEFPSKTTVVTAYRAHWGFEFEKWDRDKIPYGIGDIIPVQHHRKNIIQVEQALVIGIFSEFLESSKYLIPKYRVVFHTNKGEWSRVWKYIYPGDITRGWSCIETFNGGRTDNLPIPYQREKTIGDVIREQKLTGALAPTQPHQSGSVK